MIPAGSDGTRTLFHWTVPLQDEGGAEQVYEFASYWDPAKVDPDFVTASAVAQARCEWRVTLVATADAVLAAA